jgi:YidC/Oxa1 family membrane protein insertase
MMDNQRLILALVFCFSLFMLWTGWQKHTHAPVAQTTPATKSAAAPASATASSAATSAPVPTASGLSVPQQASAAPAAQPAEAYPVITVKSDMMVAEISAQGGDVIKVELTHHKASGNRKQDFVLVDPKYDYRAQSGLIGPGLPNHKTIWQLPGKEADMTVGEKELRVRLTAPAADDVEVSKTYVFHRGSYVIDVEYDIANHGAKAISPEAYFQLVRDGKAPADGNSHVAAYTGPAFYTAADNFKKVEFKKIAKNEEKVPDNADNGWVAMVQHYFVTAWLPAAGPTREFYAEELGAGSDLFRAGVKLPVAAIAPGAIGKLTVPFYAGPQEQEKLAKIAPGFDRVVDYGWLTVIAKPIFWVLNWLHSFTGNWGWSIILMTVMLKAAFFPLSATSYKSMAKMRLLTPKMQKIKETFADDRERMNREMMELYKKEKVNPLGGCLPIAVQIPVFIALYWVLGGTVELRGAPWLGWITDLTAKDPYYILPLIMGATMFLQTKLNPTPPDPMQAKIMMIMPIAFTAMFLFFPSGLVLYWTVSNLLSIAQQWKVNRMMEASGLKPRR